jgi:hypothetical protein
MPDQEPAPSIENNFTARDVVQILREQNWHTSELTAEQSTWCEHAAALLGPQCVGRRALENLLSLVFHYDALRQLASLLLDPVPLNSDRLREIVDIMKSNLDIRGRELFQTLRLSLAGRPGEGDLDRVILLLDEAAAVDFTTPVRSARARIIEFCSALD